MNVWKSPSLEDVIRRATNVDRASEAVLEHLLCLKDIDIGTAQTVGNCGNGSVVPLVRKEEIDPW